MKSRYSRSKIEVKRHMDLKMNRKNYEFKLLKFAGFLRCFQKDSLTKYYIASPGELLFEFFLTFFDEMVSHKR